MVEVCCCRLPVAERRLDVGAAVDLAAYRAAVVKVGRARSTGLGPDSRADPFDRESLSGVHGPTILPEFLVMTRAERRRPFKSTNTFELRIEQFQISTCC